MHAVHAPKRDFVQALLGDGRPPLLALAFGLFAAGVFALFLAATGQFLPHDECFLDMTARTSVPCTAAASSTS